MKKAVAIFLAALGLGGLFARAETVNRIVAVVGEQVITSNELERALQAAQAARPTPDSPYAPGKKELLNLMIDKLLIEQEVKRQGVSVTAQEIEQAINKKREQLQLSPSDFALALRDQGLTMDDYREQVRQSLGMAKLVSKEVKSPGEISDAEIESYYQQHLAEFLSPEKVRLLHIVVRDAPGAPKTIKSIQEQFRKGASFQGLASRYSEGEEAQNNGDLGWVELDQLKPGVKAIISGLQPGELSPVYKDEAGSHLFLVQGREKAMSLPLEQVKDKIRQVLHEKQFQDQYQVWLERLRAKTYVEIRV